MTTGKNQYTIGQIADQLEEPTQRIAYIISKYRIKPVCRMGIIRLFGPEQVEAIREGLYGIRIHNTFKKKGVNHAK